VPAYLGYLLLGAFAGGLAGMFGVGGGILIVPGLVWLFGFPQKMATGTSLAVLLPPIGLFAALRFFKAGNVNVAAAALIVAGFVLAAHFSAGVALSLPDVTLKRAFGALQIVMGVIYILTAK
jgi:uncharacterized membrane protein YfcA